MHHLIHSWMMGSLLTFRPQLASMRCCLQSPEQHKDDNSSPESRFLHSPTLLLALFHVSPLSWIISFKALLCLKKMLHSQICFPFWSPSFRGCFPLGFTTLESFFFFCLNRIWEVFVKSIRLGDEYLCVYVYKWIFATLRWWLQGPRPLGVPKDPMITVCLWLCDSIQCNAVSHTQNIWV